MKQRKLFLVLASLSLALAGVGVFAAANVDANDMIVARADKIYTMTLDANNKVVGDNYLPMPVLKTIGTITVNNMLVKSSSTGGYANLAPHGAIYNYEANNFHGRVTGIKSIKVVYSGSGLQLRVSRDLEGKIFSEKMDVTSNTEIDLSSMSPSYFYLTNGDNEIDISSIDVKYVCSERDNLTLNQIGKRYTGSKNGIIYKLDITGSSFALATLNKESNDNYSGTISIVEGQVKLAINGAGDLYFNPNDGRNKLTVDSAKGIGAAFDGLSFDEVFVVDDFEGYSGTGVGYDTDHANWGTLTGLRSNYHSDYYGGSATSLFQDSGWGFMATDTYMYHSASQGHNNSAMALFRGSANGLRFTTFESMYNVPKTMGKGAKFSFWAHGALNSAMNGNSSENVTVKVRLFFTNPILKCSDTYGEATEITIPAGSDWSQYTINLDSNKEYYGYSIYIKSTNALYVPIDDIEIYTENPYAEYEVDYNYQSFTGKGEITYTSTLKSLFKSDGTYIIMGISKDGFMSAYLIGQTFDGTSYEINPDTKEFTATGSLRPSETVTKYGLEVTGFTGTFNDDYTVLSNVTFIGGTAQYIQNNGNIVISAANLSETQEFTGATTQALQSTFKRWYMANNSWTEDPGNGDRVTAFTTDGYNDSICMRERGHAKHSLTFASNFNPTKSYHGFGYWVKNTSSKNLKTNYYSYTSQDLTDGATWMTVQTVTKAAGWSLVVCDFKGQMAIKSGITNLRLYFEMSSGSQTDYILLDHFFFY